MSAPTGRIASVAVIVKGISGIERWKSRATVGITKTSTKKSKASSVQPRKLAISVWTASAVERSRVAGVAVEVVSAAIVCNVMIRGQRISRYGRVVKQCTGLCLNNAELRNIPGSKKHVV